LSVVTVGAGRELPVAADDPVDPEPAACANDTIRAFDIPIPAAGAKIVNESAFDGATAVSVVTVMDALRFEVPRLVTSAADIAALIPDVPMNVVVRELPFQRTVEHGSRLPVESSFTVSRKAELPVVPLFAGESEVILGVGSGIVGVVIVNGEERDVVVELDTVTFTDPGKAVSVNVIAAVSCVGLTNVVARGEPFQFTTSPFAKFVPFTVKVTGVVLQEVVEFDEVEGAESDVIVGATIGNGIVLELAPPVAGVATTIDAVPTEAMSAAVMVALSCVALRTAVARLLAFHCTTEHGRKLLPVTANVNPVVPAVALTGETEAMTAVGSAPGADTEKLTELEVAEAVDTVTAAVV
jgi:hypothetical protein